MSSIDVERIKIINRETLLYAYGQTNENDYRQLEHIAAFVETYKDNFYQLKDGRFGTALALAGEIKRFDIIKKLVAQPFVDLDCVVWNEDENEVMDFNQWLHSIATILDGNGEVALNRYEMEEIIDIADARGEKKSRRIG